MSYDEYMIERGQPPVMWIAVTGINAICPLCDEPIVPGETIVEGCGDELLHLVCCEFDMEAN